MTALAFYLPGPWEILVILAVMALLLGPVVVSLIVILLVVRHQGGRPGEGSEAKSPADTQNAHATTNPDRD